MEFIDSIDTCRKAIEEGDIKTLEYFKEQKSSHLQSTWACTFAAEKGRLDVLIWLRSQNPPCLG